MRALRSLTALFLLAILPPSWAALAISNTRGLAFGTFAAGNGGTITVDPAGARTRTGGITLISVGSATSAAFTVSDNDPTNAIRTYNISLPANGTVTISNGSSSMAINLFTSNPSGTGQLAAGSQTVTVGATLEIAPNQQPGTYSGSFSITVIYQ